ncbi:hypothetical protein GCM10027516_07090 [Niabella aquatica]
MHIFGIIAEEQRMVDVYSFLLAGTENHIRCFLKYETKKEKFAVARLHLVRILRHTIRLSIR